MEDSKKSSEVGNYRPIVCLNLIWKLLTGIISNKTYDHLEENRLLSEEWILFLVSPIFGSKEAQHVAVFWDTYFQLILKIVLIFVCNVFFSPHFKNGTDYVFLHFLCNPLGKFNLVRQKWKIWKMIDGFKLHQPT